MGGDLGPRAGPTAAKNPDTCRSVFGCNTLGHVADDPFDPDLLDELDPFEIDTQAAHLFKHPHLGIEDVNDVWASDPLCCIRPSHRPTGVMCAEVSGRVLVVPLAPSRDGDPRRCRPFGCYEAAPALATRYRRDR